MSPKALRRPTFVSRVSLWVAVLLTAASSLPAAGQTPGTDYVLGPEDVLEVSVLGNPDLTRVVTVLPDGKITLPLIGIVQASGLTLVQLTRAVTRAYRFFIVEPRVIIAVKEPRKIQVSVLGQVARPGTYTLPPNAGVLQAISAAGGTGEMAALNEIRVLTPGESPVIIDLEALLAGDPAAGVVLRGGETVFVPEDQVNVVSVLGEVARPGRYRLKAGLRVLDALLLAGGITDRASITQARLVRASQEIQPLHLDALLIRQEMAQNVLLDPGDALFIPRDTNDRVYVIGDVSRPGLVPLQGELTLLQAIAAAGGPVPRGSATARTAYVVRRNGAPERQVAGLVQVQALSNAGVILTVDLNGVMRNPLADVLVQAGDVIVVPQTGLSSLQTIVSILAGIFFIAK